MSKFAVALPARVKQTGSSWSETRRESIRDIIGQMTLMLEHRPGAICFTERPYASNGSWLHMHRHVLSKIKHCTDCSHVLTATIGDITPHGFVFFPALFPTCFYATKDPGKYPEAVLGVTSPLNNLFHSFVSQPRPLKTRRETTGKISLNHETAQVVVFDFM